MPFGLTLEQIPAFYDREEQDILADANFPAQHEELLKNLESGQLRAATPGQLPDQPWQPCPWVKRAILLAFKTGRLVSYTGPFNAFYDLACFPPRQFGLAEGIRLVPGGSSVRRGSHLGRGVVVMPPSYINVGASIGTDSMVDSHVLVGSCAQIGSGVHLSAGCQIGGVLEPPGARPVVVEDEAFLGGLSGVFEGVWVRRRAVLAAGVILTASTPILDLVHGRTYLGMVPPGATVLPGSRTIRHEHLGMINLPAALIVKYRDGRTDARVALEDALRHQGTAVGELMA
jgi:2,3,4,5-tetrahydropyridine-2-carboxylate N-succinyltransferase